MVRVKKYFYGILLLTVLSFPLSPLSGADHPAQKTTGTKIEEAEQMPVFAPMPGPGKRVPLADGHYLQYGFDKKPKLGTVIMKVEIFTAEGGKDTSWEVRADAGMPSMKGAHETGDRSFQRSKKGDYLLPINIVMPGDWEIRITVLKSGKVVFRGRYNFDV